jgi:hypothetical protein
MRSRTVLGDVHQEVQPQARRETVCTYERVRRTLDEALAELQLPSLDRDDTGVVRLQPQTTSRG